MPPKSKAQQAYAGMSKTPEGRAQLRSEGKKPMPAKVADEYAKGSTKSLPAHAKPKGK